MGDVLGDDERRYDASPTADVDDLNADLAEAALRLLLQRNNGSLKPGGSAFLISSEDANNALLSRPPCRFEHRVCQVDIGGSRGNVEVDVVLDIAHNEDSLKAMVKKVKKFYPGRNIQ